MFETLLLAVPGTVVVVAPKASLLQARKCYLVDELETVGGGGVKSGAAEIQTPFHSKAGEKEQ